ncbi:hypothetical protein GCM10012285_56860 [Streptomyces kronopolitis]|uniref:4Fe-4S Wbl-type domain-containing protein n=1 Tax=Streptomyces kronopolitis TaxID=1612435 RepID=A0ABQ2JYJ2_9ACTN|nr:hypothetical protein GCM10012285_56860 [Streptomyces kronopolitis]
MTGPAARHRVEAWEKADAPMLGREKEAFPPSRHAGFRVRAFVPRGGGVAGGNSEVRCGTCRVTQECLR